MRKIVLNSQAETHWGSSPKYNLRPSQYYSRAMNLLPLQWTLIAVWTFGLINTVLNASCNWQINVTFPIMLDKTLNSYDIFIFYETRDHWRNNSKNI